MMTVKEFLEKGYEFVIGDIVITPYEEEMILDDEVKVWAWNETSYYDEKEFVKSVVWRTNTGEKPYSKNVALECVTERITNNTPLYNNTANWDTRCANPILRYRPVLPDATCELKAPDVKCSNPLDGTTEHYEVVEEIWDLKDDFNKGNLYHRICGSYQKITTTRMLGFKLKNSTVYRRVTKEWYECLDDLSYPFPLVASDGTIFSVTREWLETMFISNTIVNVRPATKEEVQELLNNVF